MVAPPYLKHAYSESHESVVQRGSQDVYSQFLSGQFCFRPRLPCNGAQIVRFLRLLGEARGEQLPKTTVKAGVETTVIEWSGSERAIAAAMVQAKAIAHPCGGRLLAVARARFAHLPLRACIALKQSSAAEGQPWRRHAGGCAHTRQFKRLRPVMSRRTCGTDTRSLSPPAVARGGIAARFSALTARRARLAGTKLPGLGVRPIRGPVASG